MELNGDKVRLNLNEDRIISHNSHSTKFVPFIQQISCSKATSLSHKKEHNPTTCNSDRNISRSMEFFQQPFQCFNLLPTEHFKWKQKLQIKDIKESKKKIVAIIKLEQDHVAFFCCRLDCVASQATLISSLNILFGIICEKEQR